MTAARITRVLTVLLVTLLTLSPLRSPREFGAPPRAHAAGSSVVHELALHGPFTTIDDPHGTSGNYAADIAQVGARKEIVGSYADSNGTYHGFLLHKGVYTTLDDPKAGSGPQQGTWADGIDPQGDIVGGYLDSDAVYHGFLLHKGVYTDVRGSQGESNHPLRNRCTGGHCRRLWGDWDSRHAHG